MGEGETTGGARRPGLPELDPPRGDEGLDDWFARRLEAQGIVASRAGFPTARIMAVGFLLAALVIVGVVLSGVGSSSTTTNPPTTPTTLSNPTTGGPTGSTGHHRRVIWKTIPLTVLNGYGGTGAAGTAETQLKAAGWKVTGAANAGTTSVTTSMVVYVAGKKPLAVIVGRRLHLPVEPITAVPGLQPASIDGVAIVLGANGLPSLSSTGTGGTTT
jgi:hypothetical protein